MSKHRRTDEEMRPDRNRSEDWRHEGQGSERGRDEQLLQQREIIRNLVAENENKSSENAKNQKFLDKNNKELIQARKSTLDAESILDGTKEELDKVKEALTKVTEAIKHSLLCELCTEPCMPPLKVCDCGKIVCTWCISQGPTKKCFYCNKVARRIRNFQLEHLTAKIEFGRPGCGPERTFGEKFLYEDATKHTNVCPQTFLLLCPFDGCNASAGFNTESIKTHFLTKHGIEENKCLGLPANKYWQPHENLTIDIKNSPQLSGQTDTINYLVETTQGIALMIQRIRDGFFLSTIYHFPDPAFGNAFGNQARFRYKMNSQCGNYEDVSSVTIIKFTEMPRWNGFLCDKFETEIREIKQVGMAIIELDQKRITKFSHNGVLKLRITLDFKETIDIQNEGVMSPDMSSPKSPEYNDVFAIIADTTSIPNLGGSSDSE